MALPSLAPNASYASIAKSIRHGHTEDISRSLPNGRCSFTNLSIGTAPTPRCGCQRFWSNAGSGSGSLEIQLGVIDVPRGEWCMCGHHACFHEITSSHTTESNRATVTAQTPQHLTTLHPLQSSFPQNVEHENYILEPHALAAHGGERIASKDSYRQTDSALPDTLQWSNFIRTGSSQLPSVPSECVLPPDISSGGFSGHAASFSANYGLGLKPSLRLSTMDTHVLEPTLEGLANLSRISEPYLEMSYIQSATDVLNPSPRSYTEQTTDGMSKRDDGLFEPAAVVGNASSSQLLRDVVLLPEHQHTMEEQPAVTQIASGPARDITPDALAEKECKECPAKEPTRIPPHMQAILKEVVAFPTLSTRMRNHEHRIDLLENASFSNAAIQEAEERIDVLEGRMCDFDADLDEFKKVYAAISDGSNPTIGRREQITVENNSMVSGTSSTLEPGVDPSDMARQLENLHLQIQSLHAAIPSPSNPCEMEVIFLPFGAEMKGIWLTPDQISSQRSRKNSINAAERSQTQDVRTQALLDVVQNQKQSWEALCGRRTATQMMLVARACGPGSKIEERLRSRGLVKTVRVSSMDSRVVQGAMIAAFGDALKSFSTPAPFYSEAEGTSDEKFLSQYHGLQSTWIPLRKVHKDSQLRFLDPSEMLTPSLWNTVFLTSSVAMHGAGTKRLYVTHREAYTQTATPGTNWTWRMLQDLPGPFSDLLSSSETREPGAKEPCWEYDERLDEPPSVYSSFQSYHSSFNIPQLLGGEQEIYPLRASHDKSSSASASPVLSITPTSLANTRAISPLLERHLCQDLPTRTNSMPFLTAPLRVSPSHNSGKRRIASFDHDGHHSAIVEKWIRSSPTRTPISTLSKRQRISRSPSRPRNTPRWSVGPSSPLHSEESVEAKRDNTPAPYATPHSNATYFDFRKQNVLDNVLDYLEDHGNTTDEIEFADIAGFEDDSEGDLGVDMDVGHQLEEEVWEGVEDGLADDEDETDIGGPERKALSEDEDDDDDDNESDVSSQPSEYPSTQPCAPYIGRGESFYIHIDEDD